MLRDIETKIAELPAREHVNRLVLICDRHMPETALYPAKAVLTQLILDLNSRYKRSSQASFEGSRETVDVFTYQLQ